MSFIVSLILPIVPMSLLIDEEGEVALRHHVTADLSEIYSSEEDFNLRQHVICARAVGEYIEDLVHEMQKNGSRSARLDVLAVCLTVVNEVSQVGMLTNRTITSHPSNLSIQLSVQVLYLRLRDVIRPRSGMQLGDLHMIIDWLCGKTFLFSFLPSLFA